MHLIAEFSLSTGRQEFLRAHMTLPKPEIFIFRSAAHKKLSRARVIVDYTDGQQVKIICRKHDILGSPEPPVFFAWKGSPKTFLDGVWELKITLAYHAIREFVENQAGIRRYDSLRQAIEEFGVWGIEEIMLDRLGKSKSRSRRLRYNSWEDERQQRLFFILKPEGKDDQSA